MDMMLLVQARAGVWAMLIVYSTLLEVSGQNTFALFFLLLLVYHNLLMLQEQLVKTYLLKTAVK